MLGFLFNGCLGFAAGLLIIPLALFIIFIILVIIQAF